MEAGAYESVVNNNEHSSGSGGCESSSECDEVMSRNVGLNKVGGENWRNGTAASGAGEGEAVAARTRLSTRCGQEGDE